MSKGDGTGQIIVMTAEEKVLGHDLEVLVQQHLQRGKLSMVQVAGILRHAATMVDLRVRGEMHQQAQPKIQVAPSGLDRAIKPPTGE